MNSEFSNKNLVWIKYNSLFVKYVMPSLKYFHDTFNNCHLWLIGEKYIYIKILLFWENTGEFFMLIPYNKFDERGKAWYSNKAGVRKFNSKF